MRICDLTMAYSATSGGIRTYIDQKRRFLLEQAEHEHVLIVPGAEDAHEQDGRAQTWRIKSPPAGHGSYRLLWRPDEILAALREARPDMVELGTFFVCPWPALRYRKEEREAGRDVRVFGYFHTDLAQAYVESPVRGTLTDWFSSWSDTLHGLGVELAELLKSTAENYFGSIFQRCDAMFTSSQAQAQRLADYGIDDAHVVPLGVDIDTFTPERRSDEVRSRYGAGPDTALLAYVGRLDAEKRALVVVNAFASLVERGHDVALVMVGDGPLRETIEERAQTLPGLQPIGYVSDSAALADLLASADVYVTAGPHETFGLSVIEAQAAGLPVVGVDAGALRSRVVDGTGLLGPVDDATAMADNVLRVLERRDACGRRAREHVEEHFSWDASFRHLLAVIAAGPAQSAG